PSREIEAPRQRHDIALPDLVHALERGDDHHIERHAEEQRADREEDEDGNRRTLDPLLLGGKGDRLVGGAGAVERGVGDRAHCTRASCRRCCQAVSSTSGMKIAAVISSMTTAAAAARPRFCACQYALSM